jgi:hypothetical protein
MSENQDNQLKHPILVGVVLLLVALGIFALFFFPFSFEKLNVGDTAKTKDVNAKSEYVYGDGPGKPARQTANTYTDTPEGQKRADALREKMFGNGISAETTAPAPDSTQKTEQKTEAKAEEKK